MKGTCALLPSLFISHGAGPAFFMKAGSNDMFKPIDMNSQPALEFKAVGEHPVANGLPEAPDAIVLISAHWEEPDAIHVLATPKPPLLFDYYGFPPETYQLSYPAPGNPGLAREIVDLINAELAAHTEFPARAALDTSTRGWDHGVFIPLLLLYPKANIPVVQVSLHSSLNPELHVAIGRAIGPLRAKNVLILGSGQATHPMATRGSGDPAAVPKFMAWLEAVVGEGPNDTRLQRLVGGFKDPRVVPLIRANHNPRTEHFAPLFVVLGAAQGAPGRDLFHHGPGHDLRFANGAFSLASWLFG
jgi:aromatic ring-opening dioxygenase catalytic subunit (LigB family)